MHMHNPAHPGEVLRDTVLREGGGITVTAFAKHLGVSRVALFRVITGKAPVSADLAIRLAAALRGSPESWLHMQVAYDLWHARKRRRPKVESLEKRERTAKRFGTLKEFFANSPLRRSGLKVTGRKR